MKRIICSFLTLSFVTAAAIAQNTPPAPAATNETKVDLSTVFKSDKDKFSYLIGMFASRQQKMQLKKFDVDYDSEMAAKGFKDYLDGTNTLIPESQMNEVLVELNKLIKSKREAIAEKAKADGIAFLEKNKTQPGVQTMTNGLQYIVLKEGAGPKPGPNDEVTVHYVGTLIDGTEFDNSKKRGTPFKTRVSGGIIPGWKQILREMNVGSSYKVFIPSELAYGPNPTSQLIPANSVLIFEMDLLSASEPAPAPPPAPPAAPLTSDIIKVPSQEEMKKGAKIETIKAEDLEKEKSKQQP